MHSSVSSQAKAESFAFLPPAVNTFGPNTTMRNSAERIPLPTLAKKTRIRWLGEGIQAGLSLHPGPSGTDFSREKNPNPPRGPGLWVPWWSWRPPSKTSILDRQGEIYYPIPSKQECTCLLGIWGKFHLPFEISLGISVLLGDLGFSFSLMFLLHLAFRHVLAGCQVLC